MLVFGWKILFSVAQS